MKISNENIKLLTDEEGTIDLYDEKVEFTGAMLCVSGDFILYRSTVNFGIKGMYVNGNADFTESKINVIPEYSHIGGSLILDGCIGIKTVPNHIRVRGSLSAKNSSVKVIGNDVVVGGNIDMSYTKIKNLPSGLTVCGNLDLRHSKIKYLPADLVVGGKLLIAGTKIKSIPSGVKVGKGIDCLPNLTPLCEGEYEEERFLYANDTLFHIVGIENISSQKTVYWGRFGEKSVVYDGKSYKVVKSGDVRPGIFDILKKKNDEMPVSEDDRCVCCGAYAVEGSQLCKKCQDQ